MAKIKTVKYVIDGREVNFDFNCNTMGIFYVKTTEGLLSELGFGQDKLRTDSLQEAETKLRSAVRVYAESKLITSLKIAIEFNAGGTFKKLPDGSPDPYFTNNPQFGSYNNNNILEFDYKVVVEKNRGGNIMYYSANVLPDRAYDISDVEKVGKFIVGSRSSIGRGDVIIDYSESAEENLKYIMDQLRKASKFLVKLLSDDNAGQIIAGGCVKLLN